MMRFIKESGNQQVGKGIPAIPAWLIWIQCIAFVALYGVWILPGMLGFRNIAMVVGAISGLYAIYLHRHSLVQRRAIPIWLIVTLFAWSVFHLFFLSQDYEAQLLEFKRIWKYAALGLIFAFGLGLSLAQNQRYWYVMYFGISAPAIIYLIKFLSMSFGEFYGVDIPSYLHTYQSSAPFYVPKSDYIPFCLPAFAIALGELKHAAQSRIYSRKLALLRGGVCTLTMLITLLLFDVQMVKNGFFYALLCVLIFVALILFQKSKISRKKRIFIGISVVVFVSMLMYSHIQKNSSWKFLMADSKIAIQLDKYDQWKYGERKGLPKNELGLQVFGTNYQRISWGLVGLQLSLENLMGYGLIEDSFAKLAKRKWPDSVDLSHTHSGWLDLALAFGIPGIVLIFTALFILIWRSVFTPYPWGGFVFWSLISIFLLWITTEAAQTVTFAALIFWLGLGAGLTHNSTKNRI